MSTPASVAKHPLHPILVTIPLGLWVFSLFADLCSLARARSPIWDEVAFYTLVGGIAGALLAAIPGFVDWFSLVTAPVKRLGTMHMVINLGVVALYAVNAWLRLAPGPPGALPVSLSVLGVVLIGVSGWLGGEMVYVHRVGVAEEAETAHTTRRAA